MVTWVGAFVCSASAVAIYLKGVPSYADALAKDGSLVITVGKPVDRRNKRRVKLIEGDK